MKRILILAALATGCSTTHESKMKSVIADLQSAKETIDTIAPSAIAAASVAAQGAEVMSGNAELVPLTQQATTLAESVLAASKSLQPPAPVEKKPSPLSGFFRAHD